jgi:hypothetical protein
LYVLLDCYHEDIQLYIVGFTPALRMQEFNLLSEEILKKKDKDLE